MTKALVQDEQIATPNGWLNTSLGQACTFRGGGTPSKSEPTFWKGTIPWVSPKDMKSDIVVDSLDHISGDAVENSSASTIPQGSVLIVVRSGILARTVPVAISGTDLTINQDLKALVPSKSLDIQFLFYLLKSKESLLLSKVSKGATVHRLATESLKSLRFGLPPISEQKRIVAILGEAFADIAKAKANAEQNLESARELFETVLSTEFGNREGWTSSPLGDKVRFIDYRGKTPKKVGSGLRLITAKNVKMGYLSPDPAEFVEPESYNGWMTRGIPNYGDVLFTTEAPLGRVAQLDTHEKVVFAQRVIIMQPDSEKLDSTFLRFLLSSSPVQGNIRKKGTGATATGIKASLLRKIEITYPSNLCEQRAIVEKLDKLALFSQDLQSTYQQKLTALEELRQSLLHQAFTGQL